MIKNKNLNFINFILLTMLIASILLLLYFFSKSYALTNSIFSYKFNTYVVLDLLLIVSLILIFFQRIKIKLFFLIIFLPIILSFYIFELYLILIPSFSKQFSSEPEPILEKIIINSEQQSPLVSEDGFDRRSAFEVYIDYLNAKVDATTVFPPMLWIDKLRGKFDKNIFPLSGHSNKKTVFCNEFGFWIDYYSDRFGFNNDDKTWDTEIDILLIGDSFTHGVCVNNKQNFSGILSNKYDFNVLNLGYEGNGPLLSFATFSEYAHIVKPKNIFWIYYEGNDLLDFTSEKANPVLNKYLKKDTIQNLFLKQDRINEMVDGQIDLEVTKITISKRKLQKNNLKFNKYNNLSGASESSEEKKLMKKNYIKRFLEIDFSLFLSNFVKLRKVRHALKFDQGIHSKNKDIDFLLSELFDEDKKISLSWGGELHFVYLPAYERYSSNINQEHLFQRKKILSMVESLDISIIDIHELILSKATRGEIEEYFPLQNTGHYSPEFYEKIADKIALFLINTQK